MLEPIEPPLRALKRDSLRPDRIIDELSRLHDDEDFSGIRCPRCRWQPTASSTWCCDPSVSPEAFFVGCGTFWNTFSTRGVCPGCRHQWRWTSCLRCAGWSPHEDWYEESKR
jgi:hypothetical protein